MDVDIRNSGSKPRQQPHNRVVLGVFRKRDENVTCFGRSGVFPEFGRQNKFSSFLKISCGQEETTKSVLKHKTYQDDKNSDIVAVQPAYNINCLFYSRVNPTRVSCADVLSDSSEFILCYYNKLYNVLERKISFLS